MENKTWNAMDYLDDDLLSAAVADMERPAPGKYAPWIRGMAIAASVAVVGGGVYLGYQNRYRFISISSGYETRNLSNFLYGWEFPMAYKSETSDFPMDAVQFTVSFGWHDSDYEYFRDSHDFHEIRLLVLDDSQKESIDDFNKYTIRFIDNEDFRSEAYFVNGRFGCIIDRQIPREFAHSETVIVPEAVFNQPSGSFCFAIGCSYTSFGNDPVGHIEYEYDIRGVSGDIYYKVRNNRVIVSKDESLITGDDDTVLYEADILQ